MVCSENIKNKINKSAQQKKQREEARLKKINDPDYVERETKRLMGLRQLKYTNLIHE